MSEDIKMPLTKEFLDYCRLNKIENIGKLARETFDKGFTILKYGETPFGENNKKLPLISRPVERPIDKTEVVIVDPPKMTVTYESTNIPSETPVKLVSVGKYNLYDE